MTISDSTSEETRFAFGANWVAFLQSIDEKRIAEATRALCEMMELDSLEGCRFLDIGCGSGLSSLAANRLGAEVVSIDFDADSVACTEELKQHSGMVTNGSSCEVRLSTKIG